MTRETNSLQEALFAMISGKTFKKSLRKEIGETILDKTSMVMMISLF